MVNEYDIFVGRKVGVYLNAQEPSGDGMLAVRGLRMVRFAHGDFVRESENLVFLTNAYYSSTSDESSREIAISKLVILSIDALVEEE